MQWTLAFSFCFRTFIPTHNRLSKRYELKTLGQLLSAYTKGCRATTTFVRTVYRLLHTIIGITHTKKYSTHTHLLEEEENNAINENVSMNARIEFNTTFRFLFFFVCLSVALDRFAICNKIHLLDSHIVVDDNSSQSTRGVAIHRSGLRACLFEQY